MSIKKEVARIEYPAIRATSFVSIVVYLQREQRVFLFFFNISHYSVTEINPFHDGSVAENTTEQGSNPVHSELYSIQHSVIKFVSHLLHLSGFLHQEN